MHKSSTLHFLLFLSILIVPSTLPVIFYLLVLLFSLLLLLSNNSQLSKQSGVLLISVCIWALFSAVVQALVHSDFALSDLKEVLKLFCICLSSAAILPIRKVYNPILHVFFAMLILFANTLFTLLQVSGNIIYFSPVGMSHIEVAVARPVGIFSNPTESSIISFLILVMITKYLTACSNKLFFPIVIALAFPPILLSGTRLTFVVLCVLLFCQFFLLLSSQIFRTKYVIYSAIASFLFAFALNFTDLLPAFTIARFFDLSEYSRLSGRWDLWYGNLEAFNYNSFFSLLFGTGRSGIDRHGMISSVTDSSFLYILHQYGLPALLVFIWICISLLLRLTSSKCGPCDRSLIILFVVGGLSYDIAASPKIMLLILYVWNFCSCMTSVGKHILPEVRHRRNLALIS